MGPPGRPQPARLVRRYKTLQIWRECCGVVRGKRGKTSLACKEEASGARPRQKSATKRYNTATAAPDAARGGRLAHPLRALTMPPPYHGHRGAGNDARWNNAVDEIKDLPNPDDATLARLWEWVVFPAEGTPVKGESAPCDQKLGTAKLGCTCERATIGAVQTEQARCPFAWQRGPAKWTKNGAVIWQSEVVDLVVRGPS